jgi:hypothetical protein
MARGGLTDVEYTDYCDLDDRVAAITCPTTTATA